jgi:hypothetical protein
MMIRAILSDVAGLNPLEEASALVALGLFLAMVAVWAQVLAR